MTTLTHPRGTVWREIWTHHTAATGPQTTTRWRWGIGTWRDGEADTWQDAYRQCLAAVNYARTPTKPPF